MLDIDRLVLDANRIDRLLRMAEESPDEERDQRYRECADAARTAFERLLQDPALDPALREVAVAAARLHESTSVVLASRSMYRAFLAAEYRLLVDHGIDPETARPLIEELTGLRDSLGQEVATASRLREALQSLRDALVDHTEDKGRAPERHRWRALLPRAVVVLGGVLIIGVDQVVAFGLAASTGGLSLAGAEISTVAGGHLIEKGTERSTEPRSRPTPGDEAHLRTVEKQNRLRISAQAHTIKLQDPKS